MILYFLDPVGPQPVLGFSLDHAVDEIGGFYRPPMGDLISLDMHLLGQDLVPDFLPGFTHVGPLSTASKFKMLLASEFDKV